MPAARPSFSARLVRVLLFASGLALVSIAFLADALEPGATPGLGRAQWTLLGMGALVAASAALPPRIGARLLVVLVALGLQLVTAELALRLTMAEDLSAIFRLAARWIHALLPNAARAFANLPADGGDRVTTRINSTGYRGAELLPPGSRRRIVVYGDSNVFAYFSPLEATFTARLADLLGPEFEVVNAGVSGFGPDQVSVRMGDELPVLRPERVVVVLFAGNDYGDLVRNKLYRLVEGRVVANRPIPDDQLVRAFDVAEHGFFVEKLLHRAHVPFERSKPPSFEDYLELCRADFEDYEREPRLIRSVFRDPYDADLALQPDVASARLKVALMEHALGEIQRSAAATRTPLTIVVLPSKFDALEVLAEDATERAKYPAYSPTRLSGTLEEMARRRGMDTVSLFPTFRGHRDYYFATHDHWSNLGQRIAAQAVLDHMGRFAAR